MQVSSNLNRHLSHLSRWWVIITPFGNKYAQLKMGESSAKFQVKIWKTFETSTYLCTLFGNLTKAWQIQWSSAFDGTSRLISRNFRTSALPPVVSPRTESSRFRLQCFQKSTNFYLQKSTKTWQIHHWFFQPFPSLSIWFVFKYGTPPYPCPYFQLSLPTVEFVILNQRNFCSSKGQFFLSERLLLSDFQRWNRSNSQVDRLPGKGWESLAVFLFRDGFVWSPKLKQKAFSRQKTIQRVQNQYGELPLISN